MEEHARRQIGILMTVLFGILYFFLFAHPLPKVLDLNPVWTSALDGMPSPSTQKKGEHDAMLSFALGDSYGYFDSGRGLSYIAKRGYGVSLSDQGFVSYDRVPESIAWKDTTGSILATTKEAGYPFMAGGRRFMLAMNQATVAEIGKSGEELWRRDFPSILTAFDASPHLALFGTLDGRLVGLDEKGAELLAFSPGGSRIDSIFGCAVSPDGRNVAAISGLDRQRLVVLEQRKEAYRVTYHRWLDSDFRRPVAMAFTARGDTMTFESPHGLGMYDVIKRAEHLVPVESPSGPGLSMPARPEIVVLETGGKKGLILASRDGRRLYTIGMVADELFVRISRTSAFIGINRGGSMNIVRLDFLEE